MSNFLVGIIGFWNGTIDSIPFGWQLCDGTNGTPNLVTPSPFILCAGGVYDVGDEGGDTSHTHTMSVSTDANATEINSFSTGVSTPVLHGHTATITTIKGPQRPPFYALLPMMKIG